MDKSSLFFAKWKLTKALVLTATLTTAWSTPQSIAVAELEPKGLGADEASIITDRLRGELLATGQFRVMERGLMDELLQEQGLQQSGACNSSECQVQVGRLLGVERLLVGQAGRLGALYTISVRLLDVETGEIIRSENVDHSGAIEGLLQGPLRELSLRLAQAQRKENIQTALPQVVSPALVPPTVSAPPPSPVLPTPENLVAPQPSVAPDAVPSPAQVKTSSSRFWTRTLLGVGTAVTVGFAYRQNQVIKEANAEVDRILANYNKVRAIPQPDAYYAEVRDRVQAEQDRTNKAELGRNVGYITGGVLATAFTLTFVF